MAEDWVVSTLARSLAFGTPLLWAAVGEVYAERAGVVNLGVEGAMITGALGGFAVAYATGNPWLGVAAAGAAGGAAGLVHAFVTVTLRANQYVSGLALTMSGLGLAALLGRAFEGRPLLDPLEDVTVPVLSGVPVLGPALFTEQNPLAYLGILAAVALWWLLFRTRAGLVVRACGENPAAADAQGVNVALVRYACVVFGGVMAGVAGGYLSVAYRPSWSEGMTGGLGWIAVAMAIFAAWNPLNAIWGALLFGALYHLSFRLQDVLAPEFLKSVPYLAVVFVLVANALNRRRRAGAPEALGLPYRRGER